MANAIPPLPTSVTKDIEHLHFDDAITQHPKLWETYGHDLTSFAVNLAVALVILLLTLWAAGWGAGLARKAMGRVRRHGGEADVTLQSFIASLTRYLIVIVGLVAVLQQLGVKTTSVLAVLGAASIAVGLALQGALSNVAAGVMLLLFRPYRVGDFIETGRFQGTVRTLDLFVTELATADNVKITAPNGKIFADAIMNYSSLGTRRVDVTFHIGPKQDLKAVLDAMQAVLAKDKRALKDPAPSYEATALNELYAEGVIRVWCKASDYVDLKTLIVLGVQTLSVEQTAPAAAADGQDPPVSSA